MLISIICLMCNMGVNCQVLFVVLLFSICRLTEGEAVGSGVYFYASEFNPRCFYEDLPGETLVKGDYLHADHEKKPLRIQIIDPEGTVVLDKAATGSGRFARPSHQAGESMSFVMARCVTVGIGVHKVCVIADPESPWPGNDKSAKVYLKIEVQTNEIDEVENLAKQTHLTELQKELQSLERKLAYIMQELDYSQSQEDHFNAQSDRINSRIIYWSLLQVSLLIASALWQINHLKAFFRAKKLV